MLELGEKSFRILQEAPQLRGTRWLFIPVTSESDEKDVEKRLLAKIRPFTSFASIHFGKLSKRSGEAES